jgi:hypothetical protein
VIGKTKKRGFVMNTIVRLMLVFMLMIVAAPTFAAEATQMWKCEMDDDASEADVIAGAQEWLKAAKTMEGGKQLQASVYFPVAVNATGEVDAFFIVVAPTFEEWGKFWDNYAGSPAEKVDIKNREQVVCPDSAVWESVRIK